MTALNSKPPSQRYREFYQRQIAKGLRAVSVWVPKDKVPILKEFVRKLAEKCSE